MLTLPLKSTLEHRSIDPAKVSFVWLVSQTVITTSKKEYCVINLETQTTHCLQHDSPIYELKSHLPNIATLHQTEDSSELLVLYNLDTEQKQSYRFDEPCLQCFLNKAKVVVLFENCFKVLSATQMGMAPIIHCNTHFSLVPSLGNCALSEKHLLLANSNQIEIWDITTLKCVLRDDLKCYHPKATTTILSAKILSNICILITSPEVLWWKEGKTELQRLPTASPASTLLKHQNKLIIGTLSGSICAYSLKTNSELYKIRLPPTPDEPQTLLDQISQRTRDLLILNDDFLLASFETSEFSLWSLNDKNQKKPLHAKKLGGLVCKIEQVRENLFCLVQPADSPASQGSVVVISSREVQQMVKSASRELHVLREKNLVVPVKDFIAHDWELPKPLKVLGEVSFSLSPEESHSDPHSEEEKGKKKSKRSTLSLTVSPSSNRKVSPLPDLLRKSHEPETSLNFEKKKDSSNSKVTPKRREGRKKAKNTPPKRLSRDFSSMETWDLQELPLSTLKDTEKSLSCPYSLDSRSGNATARESSKGRSDVVSPASPPLRKSRNISSPTPTVAPFSPRLSKPKLRPLVHKFSTDNITVSLPSPRLSPSPHNLSDTPPRSSTPRREKNRRNRAKSNSLPEGSMAPILKKSAN